MWLDEEGNEFGLPPTLAEDQSWVSQCAQGFWRDVGTGRSHQPDGLWGFPPDDEDSESESDETDGAGGEMPGLPTSGPELNEFAPYPSKTVCCTPLIDPIDPIPTRAQMYVLDLLDNMPWL